MSFEYKRTIFGFQCDIYGHVNNANYLKLYEEARSMALKDMNLPISKLNNLNIQIFVKNLSIDFIKGVKLDDSIIIKSRTKKLNRVKSIWVQEIYNSQNKLCNKVELTAVFVRNSKPFRLPKEIYTQFKKFS